MRVLALGGSLRAQSSNASLIEAARVLSPEGMEIVRYDGLADLPHFNPDLDTDEPPPSVLALRQQVGRSDALIISSPEYAGGVPGALKNGLDWLVRSLEFYGKPVAVFNAAPRAVHADSQLRLVLRTMAAKLVEDGSMVIPVQGRNLDAAAIAGDGALSVQIVDALDCLSRAVEQ